MKLDAVRWLLLSALAVIVAGAAFTSVAVMIWPEHEPVWALRVSTAGLQGGLLLTAIAGSVWILRRRNGKQE